MFVEVVECLGYYSEEARASEIAKHRASELLAFIGLPDGTHTGSDSILETFVNVDRHWEILAFDFEEAFEARAGSRANLRDRVKHGASVFCRRQVLKGGDPRRRPIKGADG